MDLTAPQKRRIAEADEQLRGLERQAQSDPQSAIKQAVQYLRVHPEKAKAAGLNVLTTQDAMNLKSRIKEIESMMDWYSSLDLPDNIWEYFADRFPSAEPGVLSGDPDITGGFERYQEVMRDIEIILARI